LLQSKVGVLSVVVALSAGEVGLGVDGARLATVTCFVSLPMPPSSSLTLTDTSAVPAPESSDQVQSKEPVLAEPSKASFDTVPWLPQLMAWLGKVSAEP
jgi:hypothetical protein